MGPDSGYHTFIPLWLVSTSVHGLLLIVSLAPRVSLDHSPSIFLLSVFEQLRFFFLIHRQKLERGSEDEKGHCQASKEP